MADLILLNGNVLTMNDDQPKASTVVVSKGNIVYVGDNEGVRGFVNDNTEIMDLQGKTLMPSFIESHTHPPHYGLNLLEVNCSGSVNSSVQDILDRVAEAAKNTPPGEWIKGWGWDDSKLVEKRYPTL